VDHDTDTGLRTVMGAVLGLSPARMAALTADSALLGALPELDSMAVAMLFGAIEDRFDLLIDDAEISSDVVETYGTLLAFVRGKRGA
jgi:acyl carrier protein